MTHRLDRRSVSTRSRAIALAAGLVLLAAGAPPVELHAATIADAGSGDTPRPSIQYEEAMAHAADTTVFRAGDRVTIPFKPRASDRWTVGGVRPIQLPAGRLTGDAIRKAIPAPVPDRALPTGASPAVGAADTPYLDPSAAIPFEFAAAVDPGGLKREVFGFLPYWQLADPTTRLDWEKLSTIAYFGVGAAASGDLQRRNPNGTPTVGWSGWTSAKLTGVINAAHASGARVVLTVQSFAWTSVGAARQRALLGSPRARANLARQIAAAVRDRGADGVNLDFEPIVSTYADEFTALVRSIRAELNRVSRGYQLTFDTTGWIGNYPIEAATAAGAADAIVIMGYDYRTDGSSPVGSVAPLGGPGYDITDTIASYVRRVPASKLILGVPYYGRAWSTDSAALHARNISGTKYGPSASVIYTTARQYAADHGRRWDPVEGVAWTTYRRPNCTASYGCVNPWRQLYYDDAQALGLKYDAINRYNLRGAGIWALGYDGARPELYAMLKSKFITDKVPPVISATSLSMWVISPGGAGRSDATTMRLTVSGQISFGWLVQPLVNGIAGAPVRKGSAIGKHVAFTWDGKDSRGAIVPDGTYRITIWTADASNNQASATRLVTVDRRPAVIALAASSSFISPDGDGHWDRVTLSMHGDEAIRGTVRLLDGRHGIVRLWPIGGATAATWSWDGRDRGGRIVADGRYLLQVIGLDRAGNRTVSQLPLTVDRTIRSLTWLKPSFVPRVGQTDHATMTLVRPARVTVAIYQGSTLVRTIWTNRPFAAGAFGWTWNGRDAVGALVRPGLYTARIAATSSIGTSHATRVVTVRVR